MKQIGLVKISLKIGLQLAVLLLIFFGCKKSDVLINGETSLMRFSNDTITFDTLFTTMGSVTKQLLVYNPNEITKKLTKIELAGGDKSMYQINVDGRAGHSFQDIEIKIGRIFEEVF